MDSKDIELAELLFPDLEIIRADIEFRDNQFPFVKVNSLLVYLFKEGGAYCKSPDIWLMALAEKIDFVIMLESLICLGQFC